VMDVSGIAGAGKSHLLKKAVGAVVSVGKSSAILSRRTLAQRNYAKPVSKFSIAGAARGSRG
jgi:hypothetical protein